MNGYTIHVYKSHAEGEIGSAENQNKWFWHMKAPNGKIVADGAEGYHNKQDLINELYDIKEAFPMAQILFDHE